jgi:hypothetical protein
LNSKNKNKNNNRSGLTLDERAFYMLQSINGTQQIIDECLKTYKKDGNMEALKIAMDGYVQLAKMLDKVKELCSYGHTYDYGK